MTNLNVSTEHFDPIPTSAHRVSHNGQRDPDRLSSPLMGELSHRRGGILSQLQANRSFSSALALSAVRRLNAAPALMTISN